MKNKEIVKNKFLDDVEYYKKLSLIIERMANFHFKWYISIFPIIAFIVTIYSFIYSGIFISNLSLILMSIFSGISCLFLYIVAALNSLKYLHMERCYRTIEEKWLNNEIVEKTFDWKQFKKNTKILNKKSFVVVSHIFFFIIILLIIIVIPLIFFLS